MEQYVKVLMLTSTNTSSKPIVNLDIEDNFGYKDPALIDAIRRGYDREETKRKSNLCDSGGQLG